MAKNDNLTDFLKDVADAIREKKGSSDLINPQDFSAEIASIQSGGGAAPASPNDVTFYDYDGTILHSYTKDEFLALTELPPLPTREGLICQEWNWDLTDAQTVVESEGVLDIGATYITDDGKTRLYIRIAAEGRMDVPLYFSQTLANGVTVDWGDGSPAESISSTGNVSISHTYTEIGYYRIVLDIAEGCSVGLGHNSQTYCVLGSSTMYANTSKLIRVELGSGIEKLSKYAFYNCFSLGSIVLSQNILLDAYAFGGCYSLRFVSFPKNATTASATTHMFYNCKALTYIAIPLINLGSHVFYQCDSLNRARLKTNASYGFYSCYSLNRSLGESSPRIYTAQYRKCYSLSSVIIPSNIDTVEDNAFRECSGVGFFDFSSLSAVPYCGNSAFSSIASDCKIIVPDALYDTWIAATNWSTYASKIIKKSDWDALNA